MEKRKINNIDCYFHYDNRFKTICLKLHFLSPYINKDNAAKTLLLRLLFKTNKKYPREDILNYKLEELYESSLYNSRSLIGCMEHTTMELYFLNPEYFNDDNYLDECLKIFEECIFNPNFTEELLEIEKKAVIKAIDDIYNNKSRYAVMRFYEIMFADEELGIKLYGNKDEIMKVTLEDVKRCYDELLKIPCLLIVAGNMDIPKISLCLEKSKITKLNQYIYSKKFKFVNNKNIENIKIKEKIEKQYINQSILCVGYRTNIYLDDELMGGLILLSGLMGGYFHSTLVQLIREQMGMAYSISTDYSLRNGFLHVYAGISIENYEKVKSSIMNVVSDYQKGFIDEDTFNLTKASMINELLRDADNLNSFNANNIFSSRPYRSIEDNVNLIKNVTKDEVVQAALTLKLDTIYLLGGVKNENI